LCRNENDPEKAQKAVKEMSDFFRRKKRSTVGNCWHVNNNESDAMWRIYLKVNEGTAIQSNINRISTASEIAPEPIYARKFRYINYFTDVFHHPVEYSFHTLNIITTDIHKRLEFRDEADFDYFFWGDAILNEYFWKSQEYRK